MDFGALPPEINSGRIYAGPGPESMLAAAAAWDTLAAELHSTANSYGSVTAGLTNWWLGPSSAAMAAAVAPFVAWLRATATHAEETAGQARAAATAYEAVFAAVVPPPMIAANRASLASLLATNIVGQNTAAIAATEADYARMWAQDAAAMYRYAAGSVAATRMTAFTTPPATTNNPAAQAAVTQGAHTASANPLLSALMALNQLTKGLPNLNPISSNPLVVQASTLAGNISGKTVLPANDVVLSIIFGLVQFQKFSPLGLGRSLEGLLPQLGAGLGRAAALGGAHVGAAASAVSAGVGRAGLVGGLSVPPSWASATPVIRMLASTLPGTTLGAAPAVLEASPAGLFSQMGLASLAGGAIGGAAPRVGAAGARRVTTNPAQLERVVAELSQQPGNPAVQHWHIDSAGLESLLADLSQKPGIHAVHVSKGEVINPSPFKAQSL